MKTHNLLIANRTFHSLFIAIRTSNYFKNLAYHISNFIDNRKIKVDRSNLHYWIHGSISIIKVFMKTAFIYIIPCIISKIIVSINSFLYIGRKRLGIISFTKRRLSRSTSATYGWKLVFPLAPRRGLRFTTQQLLNSEW